MNGNKSKMVMATLALALTIGFTGSATAVTVADTSVDIETPESDDEVSAGSFSGVPYEVDVTLEDSAENDSEIDTNLTLTYSGEDYVVELDEETLEPGETHTYSGDSDFDDYEYPEDDEEHDVTLTADAEYTDEGDSSTATATDSVEFSVVESGIVALIALLFLGIAGFAVAGKATENMFS